MWKTQLNRTIRQVRFTLKSGPEHHGTWKFVSTRFAELKMLNRATFFTLDEFQDSLELPSAVHFIFGDETNAEKVVETAGLTENDMEKVFKDMVAHGATLTRTNTRPQDSVLPHDIVEAHMYNQFEADAI